MKKEMSSQNVLTEQQFSRFQTGDKTEFRRVYDQYFNLVYYVGKRCGLSDEEAMDAVQESFFSLYKNASRIESLHGLKSWLVTTVRNRALDHIRKQKLEQKQLVHLAVEFEGNQQQSMVSDTLLRELEVKLLGDLLGVIERETNDDTLTLFYQQGLSAKMIAETKGEPVSTVTNRISRGRKKFRETIESHIKTLHENVY